MWNKWYVRHKRKLKRMGAITLIAAAAAIDRTESGGNGLGAQFAETVEIRCDARP